MDMHQRLHPPRIHVVDMVMPQRCGQQIFRQANRRERRHALHLRALAPLQRVERVDQLPLDIVALRQTMQRLPAQILLCDLPLKFDAVCAIP